ncbi:hypothetical protein GCM10010140_35490 [Streptosporangium pseudovulgare]|uniref:Transposase n=1 Tax=Streptosporangium pseudovulgare TaxID=35765 RepID=A0ABQ2QYN9_9ACTN|nr:hypothetical protein GCM10010140_35490 [Streptosporangium pseudovulgare]
MKILANFTLHTGMTPHPGSRTAKGSANRNKAAAKVARAHTKVADTRRDFAHKLSTQIIRDNQAAYVENLSVKGLARTRLAMSVHDAGWSRFIGMLEYKAARYGRHFAGIDRWFPSSKLCSACGAVAESMIWPGRTGPVPDVLYSAAGNSADEHWFNRGIIGWDFEVGADEVGPEEGLAQPPNAG